MGRASSAKRQRRQAATLETQEYLSWCGEMCGSCAYRAGTEANEDIGDPDLSVRRRLLLETYEPFFCHEPCPIPGADRLKLCVGHMRAMAVRGRRDRPESQEIMLARKRLAHLQVKAIEATLWQCGCGWNARLGEPCANPIHRHHEAKA